MHHFNRAHFFRKKEINSIYVSIFLMTLAESLISIFVPIYLYSLGYSIPAVIFYYFLISFFFVLLSTLGARVLSRVGIKYAMLLSTPLTIFYYMGLNFIQSSALVFLLLPSLLASGLILFNYGFHMNYIEHSDMKKEGRQYSFIGILVTVATALGPLVAGYVILVLGYSILFALGSLILVSGTLPLFFIKERHEEVPIDFGLVKKYLFDRKHARNVASFMGYAVESIIGRTIWPVFLIILLLKTETVGLLVTATLLVSIMTFYLIGNFTDRIKDKMKLVRTGTLLYFFGWLGRLFVNSPLSFMMVDSYKNVTEKVLRVPFWVNSYDIARKEQYFVFIVMREISFNLVRIIVLPLLALVFWAGFYPFEISFITAALFTLLYPLLKKA